MENQAEPQDSDGNVLNLELLHETNTRVWLPREEEYLVQLIKILQPKKWTHIAKELNKALYNGRQIKTPK